ncbi:MAG TPA: hypothetical protein VFG83_07175 [Kofleriaceae bacterium]|nr:hypothetical protein [Kofleriaceae bacterium]
MSMFKKISLLAFGLALCAGGCKQGEGDHCQIDNDCEQGLECNAATQECQAPGSSVPDAAPEPEIDGATTDAAPVDAAPVDASTTDAPPVDAGPDAAPPDSMPPA